MNWDEAVHALFALEKRGIKLELTRMRAALDALGRPQDAFASLLVAGTNGKGSVAAGLASALARSDRTVGLYTSPHLLDYRERIRIQGRLAEEQLLLGIIERDWETWQRHELSFFEATTALAFCAFREAGVRLAVLEVGLGGRLDATNTVEPILSVITTLGMDHAHLLGATPGAIALEKAGIIRGGVPVALAGGGPEAIRAVLGRAGELGAEPFLLRACLRVGGIRRIPEGMSFRVGKRKGAPGGFELPPEGLEITTTLSGVHQVINASLAVLALCLLRENGWEVKDEEIRRGLSRLRWPGRMERPIPGTALLADVAHNREGARVLSRALSATAGDRMIRPVVGMLQQKDHGGFFRELRRLTDDVRIAPLDDPRAAALSELVGAAEAEGFRVRPFATIAAAMEDALAGSSEPNGPLVVLCGSFHALDEGYRRLGLSPLVSLWDEVPA